MKRSHHLYRNSQLIYLLGSQTSLVIRSSPTKLEYLSASGIRELIAQNSGIYAQWNNCKPNSRPMRGNG